MIWWWTLGITIVIAVVAFFMYRKMNAQKAEFDKMYGASKQVMNIFVLSKKIVKQPIRPGLKFPKVKTYQIKARVTISQSMKGANFTNVQTHTFMMEKKEFEKILVNQKYKVEVAGNYIGKILSGKKAG